MTALAAFALLYLLTHYWGEQNWAYQDQVRFHIPYANDLAAHGFDPFLPGPSATTPGAHLLYGLTAAAVGATPIEARSWIIAVLGSLFGAATITLLAQLLRGISGAWRWWPLLLLPVVSSQYFLLPAAYLVTEGIGYTCIAAFLVLAGPSKDGYVRRVAGGLALAVLVLTRQIYLPVAMVMLALWPAAQPAHRAGSLLVRAVATLLPLVVFVPFLLQWRGLTPPGFAKHESGGLNLAAVLQSVALLGLLSVPLLLTMWRSSHLRRRAVWLGAALVASLLLLVLAPTNMDAAAGRYGSLIWTISGLESARIGFHPVLLILVVAGVATLLFGMTSRDQQTRLAAAGYATYSLVLALQSYSWQRYSEVFALIFVSLIAARVLPTARWTHLLGFSVYFLCYFAATVIIRQQ